MSNKEMVNGLDQMADGYVEGDEMEKETGTNKNQGQQDNFKTTPHQSHTDIIQQPNTQAY